MTVHDDRVGLDPWVLGGLVGGGALLAGTAAQLLATGLGLAGTPAFTIGALCGLGLVAGARSVSIRVAARSLVAVSALVQVRVGVLGGSLLTGSQLTLGWMVTAAAVLVLSDLVETSSQPTMRGWAPPTVRGSAAARTLGTVALLVAFVLVVAPLLLPMLSETARSGMGPRLEADDGAAPTIRADDTLDMTTRPDLTDDIMFTVTADRGTFWRGQTYDAWDGRRWSRTDTRRFPLAPGGEVVPAADDLGAAGTDVVTQRFRMETTYSDVVMAAASPVSIESRHDVLQGADGTLVTAGVALGRDSTYTVVSRRPVLAEDVLRAAPDEVPAEISERYASPPVASERVVRSAREAVAGATNTYDRVRALETWMGERTEYSLDAPLSPEGVDVVDHFLFESRQGWCEQVASSLVVMARANGIPARLVTGFVPGEVDRVTGTYTVRGRDAHAWAEVWFAGVGWVPFDPTAEVPLAGSDPADRSIGQWILDHAVLLLMGAVVLAAAAYGVVRLLRVIRSRRAARPVGWVAETDARLVEIGARCGWPRADSETASRFARSLALHVHDLRLVEVGAAIDDALYARSGPDDETRARVDVILDTFTVPEATSGEGSRDDLVGSRSR